MEIIAIAQITVMLRVSDVIVIMKLLIIVVTNGGINFSLGKKKGAQISISRSDEITMTYSMIKI